MPRRTEHEHALWSVLAAIALGGALGGAARYAVSTVLPSAPTGWPWATLLVNLSGCALIGALTVLVAEGPNVHRLTQPFLGVGVLGGYTTFSTFAADTVLLVDGGRPRLALGYLAVTATATVLAVALGVVATRAAAMRAGRGGSP